MKRAINIKAVFRSGFAIVALLLFAAIAAQGQGLMREATTKSLDRQQQTYLKTVTDNPINGEPILVNVDLSLLKNPRFALDLGTGETYMANRQDRGSNYGSMTSWCGSIPLPNDEPGQVNMVINGDELVAHFAVAGHIFRITPLGKGVHAFYEVFTDRLEPEECFSNDGVPDTPPQPGSGPDEQDLPDLKNNSQLNQAKSTGDCKIRVLVGYTPSARGQFTSILAELVNQFNLANASYAEAVVSTRIEMAAAIQYSYTESGNNETDRNRWRGTSDGYMDDVHSDRSLYDADMCALITNAGGGIAYISLNYADQFSVTGTGNFGVYTFHHELGHNMLCTHDATAGGVAPYRGYGSPSGCFRTIMAYSSACGTGACSRVNIWSRSVDTYYCGGFNYVRGGSNNRNRDRLVLSDGTIVNYQVSLDNPVYGGDYNWYSEEAIHMAANNTFLYQSGVNNWEMWSGSEGSFRASDAVTLGEGFWARAGSEFTAYLESCSDLLDESASITDPGFEEQTGVVETPMEKPMGNTVGSPTTVRGEFLDNFYVYPNPFDDYTTLSFHVDAESELSISVRDLVGREVLTTDGLTFPEGQNQIDLPTGDWAAGIYLLSVRSGDKLLTRRIVKNK